MQASECLLDKGVGKRRGLTCVGDVGVRNPDVVVGEATEDVGETGLLKREVGVTRAQLSQRTHRLLPLNTGGGTIRITVPRRVMLSAFFLGSGLVALVRIDARDPFLTTPSWE